jgi:hypothetical protein
VSDPSAALEAFVGAGASTNLGRVAWWAGSLVGAVARWGLERVSACDRLWAMRCVGAAAGIVVAVALCGVSSASAETPPVDASASAPVPSLPPVKLFAQHGVARSTDLQLDAMASRAVARVASVCRWDRSDLYSQCGGLCADGSVDENRIRECESAMRELSKAAAAAVGPALDMLDEPGVPNGASRILIAHVKRLLPPERFVPIVVRMLDRKATFMGVWNESFPLELWNLEFLFEELTGFNPSKKLLLPGAIVNDGYTEETTQHVADAWRAWFRVHGTQTRAQWEQDAIEEAQQWAVSSDTTLAYLGARRLGSGMGLRVGGVSAVRTGLTALRRLRERLREQEMLENTWWDAGIKEAIHDIEMRLLGARAAGVK